MRLPSSSQITHAISHFLHRFHVIVFVLCIVGGLSAVTLLLNAVVTAHTVSNDASSQNNFDAATIEKIKTLQTANQQNSSLTQPEGRSNPFN